MLQWRDLRAHWLSIAFVGGTGKAFSKSLLLSQASLILFGGLHVLTLMWVRVDARSSYEKWTKAATQEKKKVQVHCP